MGAPDKGFFGTEELLPTTCAGFDDYLAGLVIDDCQRALNVLDLLDPVNLRVYCECSGVEPPALACDLCDGGALVDNADESEPELNGFSCTLFNDIVSSIVDPEVCQNSKAAAPLCCAGRGTGGNVVLPDDDIFDGGNIVDVGDGHNFTRVNRVPTIAPTPGAAPDNTDSTTAAPTPGELTDNTDMTDTPTTAPTPVTTDITDMPTFAPTPGDETGNNDNDSTGSPGTPTTSDGSANIVDESAGNGARLASAVLGAALAGGALLM